MDEPRTDRPVPARSQGLPLRQRVITLAAQIISVVFAVLVALAADEWWEERENAELGRRGVAAVTAEIRDNLDALESRREQTTRVLASVDSALALMATGVTDVDVNINYPVALLSSAAWQTAQVTRAVHFVEIDTVIRIARVYNLQEFFLRNQERLTDQIADLASNVRDDPQRVVRDASRGYRVVTGFRDALATAYRCILIQLDGGDPSEGEGCAAT